MAGLVAVIYGNRRLRRVSRNHTVCDRVRRQSGRSEVDRFGRGGPADREHAHQYHAARVVRRTTQRDGAAGLQALVDAVRAALHRTEYIRAVLQSRAVAAVLAVAADSEPIWWVQNPVIATALEAISFFGWGLLFVSTFMLSHFELFGLSQVFARLFGKELPAAKFHTPLLYRLVRHPIYLSFLLAFWATPLMTAGHLLFAVATTGYILIGIQLEERDLIGMFGDQYRSYKERVSMLLPLPGRKFDDRTDRRASAPERTLR